MSGNGGASAHRRGGRRTAILVGGTLVVLAGCSGGPGPAAGHDEVGSLTSLSVLAARPAPVSRADIDSLPDAQLDDEVWLAMSAIVRQRGGNTRAALATLTPGQRMYYATRLLEWEAGNGGMAQYFFNGEDATIDDAIGGYELLGHPEWAQIVRDAKSIAAQELATMPASRGRDPEAINDYLEHSRLNDIDGRFASVPWADDLRIAYVRAHPDEFTFTSDDLP